jgi:hypothetical protein
MPFGFGGSTSSSTSQSTSFDRSSSASGSGGAAVAGSQDSVAFEDVFARLFGGAEGAAAGLDPSMLTGAANTLFSSGSGFMSSLGQDAGTQYMQDRIGADNPELQQQIAFLGEDLGNFFNEQLMPGITSQAVGGGQLGGGRQGIAQSAAMREVGSQFARGASAMRSADIGARDAVAGQVAGNTADQAAVGLGGMSPMMGIANAGFSAGMAPMERLASILGGPTTLNNSFSTSADWANAWSNSYGESQATQSSSGKAFSMGF